MKYGERYSQLNSGEYDWLGPELTRNKQGRYILISPMVLINPTRMVLITCPKLVSHYPPLAERLLKSGYVPHVQYQCANPSPHNYRYTKIIRLSYIDFYNHFKVNHILIVGTLLLIASHILKMRSLLRRK